MKQLIVYLLSDRVGTLEQDDSGLLAFRYDPQWLYAPGAMPLSRSLPLQPESCRGKHARPFFAGILPDQGPREQIARILGISDRNDFAMLERIGGECAGAVTLLPEEAPYPKAAGMGLRELSDAQLQEIVTELPRRPLMAGTEGLRLSLAGSQAKLPVVIRDGTIALPLGDTPSTHIIKLEPAHFSGLVANEMLCMTLAKAIGLNVPAVFSRIIGDKPCILVQRYDRYAYERGEVARVHQEDFCQAMGIPPEQKYQQEGGPPLRDCIAMLRQWSTIPALDVLAFLDAVIFNVLIGNADAHGKNYSVIYRDGQRRLAPLYDLVCTLAWPELSKTPAMKIGKSDSLESITAAHWQKMAQETQVGWPMLRDRIGELGQRTLEVLRSDAVRRCVAEAHRVASIIEQRAASLMAEVR